MKLAGIAGAMLIFTPCFTSCGDGGGGSGSNSNSGNNTNNLGYLFGERLGVSVYMQPSPPAYTFPAWSGTVPNIRINEVTPFSSTVNPQGADIYEPTTQVAFGQVTGPITGKEVIVYSYTNEYYIQPLTSTTININADSTLIAPAHPGQISALLVAQGYSPPDTTGTLPAVDDINVFAVATAGVNASISSGVAGRSAVAGGAIPVEHIIDATPEEQRMLPLDAGQIADADSPPPITNSKTVSRGQTIAKVTEILGQPQTRTVVGKKEIYV